MYFVNIVLLVLVLDFYRPAVFLYILGRIIFYLSILHYSIRSFMVLKFQWSRPWCFLLINVERSALQEICSDIFAAFVWVSCTGLYYVESFSFPLSFFCICSLRSSFQFYLKRVGVEFQFVLLCWVNWVVRCFIVVEATQILGLGKERQNVAKHDHWGGISQFGLISQFVRVWNNMNFRSGYLPLISSTGD